MGTRGRSGEVGVQLAIGTCFWDKEHGLVPKAWRESNSRRQPTAGVPPANSGHGNHIPGSRLLRGEGGYGGIELGFSAGKVGERSQAGALVVGIDGLGNPVGPFLDLIEGCIEVG